MIRLLTLPFRAWHAWRAHRLTKRADRLATAGDLAGACDLRTRVLRHEQAADPRPIGEGVVTAARPPN